jgi:hypothetical protein
MKETMTVVQVCKKLFQSDGSIKWYFPVPMRAHVCSIFSVLWVDMSAVGDTWNVSSVKRRSHSHPPLKRLIIQKPKCVPFPMCFEGSSRRRRKFRKRLRIRNERRVSRVGQRKWMKWESLKFNKLKRWRQKKLGGFQKEELPLVVDLFKSLTWTETSS